MWSRLEEQHSGGKANERLDDSRFYHGVVDFQVDDIYPNGFPTGRIDYYVESDNRKRTTKTEERLRHVDIPEIETSLRKAAEVHREVRSYIQSRIHPGLRFWDLCCDIEDKVRYLVKENGPLVYLFLHFHPGRNGIPHRRFREPRGSSLHTESWRHASSPLRRCNEAGLRNGSEWLHHRFRLHGRLRPPVLASPAGHARRNAHGRARVGNRRASR